MKRFKNLEEIIELCKEELENNDENIAATLDLEDLKELQKLLNKLEELQKENKTLKEQDFITVYMQGVYDEEKNWKSKIKEEIKELNGYIEKWRAEKDKPEETCKREIMRLAAQVGMLEFLLIEEE